MLTILLRTVLVYTFLIITMRLMGKRQLGELEISELVTTLLISEIASLPIVDQSIPLMFAVIPLITLFALEVFLSMILLKCPKLKNLASTRPSILVRRGKVDQQELERNRISIDELISEIRQAGYPGLDEVDYAIVEQNGKISVLPKKSTQPPSAGELGVTVAENGLLHIIIADGHLNAYNLRLLGLKEDALQRMLEKKRLCMAEVFLLGCDDAGNFYWIEKEGGR